MENLDMKSDDYYDSNIKIDLSSLSLDNLSWKTAEPEGMSDMKKCLNFALTMVPTHAILWLMGIVALENADELISPLVFSFLWIQMVRTRSLILKYMIDY